MDAGEVSGAHLRVAGGCLPPVFCVVWPQGHIQILVGAQGRTLLIAPLLRVSPQAEQEVCVRAAMGLHQAAGSAGAGTASRAGGAGGGERASTPPRWL